MRCLQRSERGIVHVSTVLMSVQLSSEASSDVRRGQRVVAGLRLHVPAEDRLAVGMRMQVAGETREEQWAHECRYKLRS